MTLEMVECNQSSPLINSTSKQFKCKNPDSYLELKDSSNLKNPPLESVKFSNTNKADDNLNLLMIEDEIKGVIQICDTNGNKLSNIENSYKLHEKSNKKSSSFLKKINNNNYSKSKSPSKPNATSKQSSNKINIKKLRFKKSVQISTVDSPRETENRVLGLKEVGKGTAKETCTKSLLQSMSTKRNNNVISKSPSSTKFLSKEVSKESKKNPLIIISTSTHNSPKISKFSHPASSLQETPKTYRKENFSPNPQIFRGTEKHSPSRSLASNSPTGIYSSKRQNGNKIRCCSSLQSTPKATPKGILNKNYRSNGFSSFVSSGNLSFSSSKWSPVLSSNKTLLTPPLCSVSEILFLSEDRTNARRLCSFFTLTSDVQ